MNRIRKSKIWLWAAFVLLIVGVAVLVYAFIIGRDGKYRLASDGQAQQGYWEDAQTFVINVFDVGQLTRKVHFDANRLELTIPEAGLAFACNAP